MREVAKYERRQSKGDDKGTVGGRSRLASAPGPAIPATGASNGMAGGADLILAGINQGLAAASTVPPVVFSLPW